MDVILFESVPNLGTVGDTVRVKPGYARNYLIPQGKAVPATPENRAEVESRRADLEKHEAEVLSAARAKAEGLTGLEVTIARKAGEEGKLFGSVGTVDIVEAIGEQGIALARHNVQLPEGALRQVGGFDIEIRLHPEVQVTVRVDVVAEE
jgi:large subunit ribosomal protein L9